MHWNTFGECSWRRIHLPDTGGKSAHLLALPVWHPESISGRRNSMKDSQLSEIDSNRFNELLSETWRVPSLVEKVARFWAG